MTFSQTFSVFLELKPPTALKTGPRRLVRFGKGLLLLLKCCSQKITLKKQKLCFQCFSNYCLCMFITVVLLIDIFHRINYTVSVTICPHSRSFSFLSKSYTTARTFNLKEYPLQKEENLLTCSAVKCEIR